MSEGANEGVSESRFYMWRAIFAMAHADGVVTEDEVEFLHEYLDHVNFSAEQEEILKQDLMDEQDIGGMYSKITDKNDRSQFFFFARMLVWSDGDYDEQEKEILHRLKKSHLSGLDMDEVSESIRSSADQVAEDVKLHGREDNFNFWNTVKQFKENTDKTKPSE